MSADGTLVASAMLGSPIAVNFDSKNRLLIADTNNNRILRVVEPVFCSGKSEFEPTVCNALGKCSAIIIIIICGRIECWELKKNVCA